MTKMRTFAPCLLLLATALLAACGGGGADRPSATNGPSLARTGAVATASPWAVPPAPIFIDGTSRPGATPRLTGGQTTYTVQAGDSPASIAERFGVNVDDLMRANNITDPTRLAVGQVLIIPGAPSASTPTPRPGAPTTTPSPRPIATPTPSPRPSGQAGACGEIYVVQAGDFPGLIADKCGVDVDELLRLNGITDPTSLQIGQEIRIPRR